MEKLRSPLQGCGPISVCITGGHVPDDRSGSGGLEDIIDMIPSTVYLGRDKRCAPHRRYGTGQR